MLLTFSQQNGCWSQIARNVVNLVGQRLQMSKLYQAIFPFVVGAAGAVSGKSFVIYNC